MDQVQQFLKLKVLSYVAPEDIDSVWPAVEPGLERLFKKAERKGHKPDWTPRDVKGACKLKKADLLLCYIDGKYAGWVLIALTHNLFTGEPSLLIWIAHTLHKQAKELAIKDLYHIAHTLGIKRLTFTTVFKGWERRLPDTKWKLAEVSYERILEEGEGA